MWSRSDVKSKGKMAFKANYWMCVLVSLILAAVSAAQSASSRGNSDEADLSSALNSGASAVGMSTSIFTALVAGIVGLGVVIALLIGIFVKNVLIVGCNKFFVDNIDSKPPVSTVVCGFKSNYKNIVIAMFLKSLFVGLWSLLFLIPGIIKAYEYRMVPYLVSTNPDLSWKEAFAQSKEMMTGNKGKAFVLDLSFIGWFILGAITCGVVEIFWTLPYYNSTCAQLYVTLKENA